MEESVRKRYDKVNKAVSVAKKLRWLADAVEEEEEDGAPKDREVYRPRQSLEAKMKGRPMISGYEYPMVSAEQMVEEGHQDRHIEKVKEIMGDMDLDTILDRKRLEETNKALSDAFARQVLLRSDERDGKPFYSVTASILEAARRLEDYCQRLSNLKDKMKNDRKKNGAPDAKKMEEWTEELREDFLSDLKRGILAYSTRMRKWYRLELAQAGLAASKQRVKEHVAKVAEAALECERVQALEFFPVGVAQRLAKGQAAALVVGKATLQHPGGLPEARYEIPEDCPKCEHHLIWSAETVAKVKVFTSAAKNVGGEKNFANSMIFVVEKKGATPEVTEYGYVVKSVSQKGKDGKTEFVQLTLRLRRAAAPGMPASAAPAGMAEPKKGTILAHQHGCETSLHWVDNLFSRPPSGR